MSTGDGFGTGGSVDAEIRPEAKAAAAWWASRLGNAEHDFGQADPSARRQSDITAVASALMGRTFAGDQREAFRRELATVLEERLTADADAWRPDCPRWGSARRAVYNDYGHDPALKEAAGRAGITLKILDLPLKTCMWVNPGHVSVREGHGAEIVTVWGEEREATES
jgi:hypothetical protein